MKKILIVLADYYADISSELTISVVCCDVTGFCVLSDFGALGVLGVLSVLVCLGALVLLGALLGFFALFDLRVTLTLASSPPIPRKPALPRLMVSTSTSVRSTFSSIRASSTASSTVRALRSTVSIVYLR